MPHVCGTPLYRIKPTMFWHFSRGHLHMSQIWFVNPIGGEAYSSRMGLKPLRRQNTRRFFVLNQITFRDMVFKVLWKQQACNLGRKKDWFFVLLFLEPYGNRLKLFKVIPLNHLNTQFWTAQGYPAVVRAMLHFSDLCVSSVPWKTHSMFQSAQSIFFWHLPPLMDSCLRLKIHI